MADLGSIIGSAIAGGLQGGGEAAEKSLALSQKGLQDQDLVKMQSQLDEAKQMRILEANQAFQSQQTAGEHAFQLSRDDSTHTFETGLHSQDNASRAAISAADNASAEKRTGMSVSAELAVANISAATSRANAMLSAQGGSVIQGDDGKNYFVNHQGQTAPLMTPDGQQVYGTKMSEAAKITLGILTKQASDPNGTDDSRAAATQSIRDFANAGYDPTKFGAKPMSAYKQQMLLSNPTPQNMQMYDQATGVPGSAKALIAQTKQYGDASKPGAATDNPFTASAPKAAVGMPGTPDAGAGTNNPPLPPTSDPMGSGVAPIDATPAQPVTPAVAPAPAAPLNTANLPNTPASTGTGLIAQQQAAQQTAGLGPLVAGAQTTAPATQQAFRQNTDAWGRPIPPNPITNPIGLPQ